MNILVISSNLIGDSILSTGIIKYFVDKNSNSKLTLVVGPTAEQVYKNFPNLHNTIVIAKKKFSLHWIQIWKMCLFTKWDIIIDFRSSALSYFLFRNKNYIFKHTKNENKVIQFKNFFNLKEIAYPVIFNNKEEEKIANDIFLAKFKYVVIAPGGNWIPKVWPSKKINQLLKKLLSIDNNILFVLIGSDKENKQYKNEIIKNIDNKTIIDLMGENITQTYAFIKKCNLFIGNDSGLMHLAAASRIPTIGLFGPTDNNIYAPYGKKCFVVRTKETFEYFKNIKIDINKSYMNSINVDDIINVIVKNRLI